MDQLGRSLIVGGLACAATHIVIVWYIRTFLSKEGHMVDRFTKFTASKHHMGTIASLLTCAWLPITLPFTQLLPVDSLALKIIQPVQGLLIFLGMILLLLSSQGRAAFILRENLTSNLTRMYTLQKIMYVCIAYSFTMNCILVAIEYERVSILYISVLAAVVIVVLIFVGCVTTYTVLFWRFVRTVALSKKPTPRQLFYV